jgi:hypothetical protein
LGFTKTLELGTQQYAAQHDRLLAAMATMFCEGVMAAPAPGANPPWGDVRQACLVQIASGFAVSVGAGWCLVQGDHQINQGMYLDYCDGSGTTTDPFGAPSGGSQQRVDLLCASINDSEHTSDANPPQDQMGFRWVQGLASATASIADYAGGAALPTSWPQVPSSSLLLAAVEIHTGESSIQAGRISDMRRVAGPAVFGEDGKRYRLGVSATGQLGVEEVTSLP